MKTRTFILFILPTVLTCFRAVAVGAAMEFTSMVPQGAQTVCSMTEDATGLLWTGTDNGLYTYDGYRFSPRFEPGGRSNTRVHALLEHGGMLYLGTDNGLLVYSISKGRYIDRNDKTSKHKDNNTGEVRALCLDGNSVVCGAARGLFRYDTGSGRLSRMPHHVGNVYSLLNRGGELLAGTLNGLYSVKGARCTMVRLSKGSQPLVNALLSDGQGGVWVGTEGFLLHLLKDGSRVSVKELNGNSIKSLARRGVAVFAGTDNGLYAISGSGQISHYTHDSRNLGTISNDIVWALTTDRYGNLWTGTDNGLSVNTARSFGSTIGLGRLTDSGAGNCIYDMLREPDGTLWLGGSAGLIRYTPQQGSPWQGGRTVWFRQNSAATHLTHNRVRRIYRDRQGDILLCTDHGINYYDRRTGTFRNFIVTDRTGRMTATWAYDIIEDNAGRYWISSYNGGVFIINKQRLLASERVVVADKHLYRGLHGLHVGRMALNRFGQMYLQLYKDGIDAVSTRTLGMKQVLADYDDDIGFIMTDNVGEVWAAGSSAVWHFRTDGSGRRVYTLKDGSARRITSMCAVGNDVLVVVGSECIVFSRNGRSMRFAVPGGLTPLSVCWDKATSSVLFGGNDALAVLPLSAVKRPDAKRLLLSDVSVNGKQFGFERPDKGQTDRIELAADENNITIKLTDIPYSGQRKCVYAYMLEGVDHSWQFFKDGSLEIDYNALPHGHYTLHVCKVDGQGRPAAEVYALSVVINPPYYLTVLAKMFYALIVAGLIAWGVKFYIMRRRLADERRARRQVMEQSQARAAFYSALSRKLKSPLAGIMRRAGDMEVKETDPDKAHALESIRRDSAAMSILVYEALDQTSTSPRQPDEAKDSRPSDFVGFCRNTLDDACRNAGPDDHNVTFKTDSPLIMAGIDMPVLYPLLYAFMTRAMNLAGKGGTVMISLSTDCGEGKVSLKLDIPSFTVPSDELPFLFYRYRRTAGGGLDGGENNELAALKELAERDGGTMTVQTDEDHGTVFILTLNCEAVPAEKEKPYDLPVKAAKTNGTSTPENSVSRPDVHENDLLNSITSVIEAHLSDTDFSVSKLAAEAGIGDKSLYRKVKQLTDMTPVELIRHIRMQQAAMMLHEGKFTVSEVMYMVGFQNSSYFSKCFAKAHGMTPAEYAKKASL